MQRQEWNRVSWKHMPGVKDKAMKKTGQVYPTWNWDSGWPWLRMGKGRRSLLYDQSDLPSTSSGFILRFQAATGVALLFSKGKGKGKIRVVSLSLKITRQLYESCILTSHWPDPTIEWECILWAGNQVSSLQWGVDDYCLFNKKNKKIINTKQEPVISATPVCEVLSFVMWKRDIEWGKSWLLSYCQPLSTHPLGLPGERFRFSLAKRRG